MAVGSYQLRALDFIMKADSFALKPRTKNNWFEVFQAI